MSKPLRRPRLQALHRKPATAGFSLLELMMVMVIIGVLVSIFTLSMNAFSDDETAENARRLEALINLATEEASMQGRELGLQFYQHGYEFSARLPGTDEDGLPVWQWEPLEDDRMLRPRDLGEDFLLELFIEGKEVDLEYDRDESGEDNNKEPYEPQIFLLSSGDIFPAFSARIRPEFSDSALLVTVEPDGKTEVSSDEF